MSLRLTAALTVALLTWSAAARADVAPAGGGPAAPPGTATATPPPAYPPAPSGALPPAYPPPPAPPGTQPTAAPAPPAWPAPMPGQGAWGAQGNTYARPVSPGVYVELQTDDPNTRIDRVIEGSTFPVCRAPCRMVLDRTNVYVIAGDGVRPTSHFLLPDDRDRVTLNVKAGSSSRLATGAVVMVAGGIVGYAGIFVVEAAALRASNITVNSNTQGTNRATAGVGLAMMAGGLIAFGIGAYVALTAGTTVTSSTGATFSEAAPIRRKRSSIALTPRGIEF